MGQRPRSRPERLAAKLLVIRQRLGVNQTEMAKLLECDNKRMSEWELGRREPSLLMLLNYARLAKVPVDNLIDDDLDLPL
jgi:transcriptional regulator with XRE-family HTH domain